MVRTHVVCLLVLLALLGTSGPLAAQEELITSDCTIAMPGDSFWRIADHKLTADQWKVLWGKNPTTPNGKPRRFFVNPANGWPYVHVDVGEQICGLKEAGVVPTIATPQELASMGLSRVEKTEVVPNWLWWILGILAVAVLYAAFRAYQNTQALRVAEEARRQESERAAQEIERMRHEEERRREPEQLGTPVVAGGIQPTEIERLQNFFQEQAVSAYVARHPELGGNRSAVRPTLIGQIEHGMLSGEGQVCDLNGNWHDSLIEPPGRPGYQARFRYPDGSEEVMQSYQACMNPVRSGQGMRGFTFVPNTQATTQPAPAPEPAPAVVPQPELVPVEDVATTESPEDSFEEIQLREPDAEGFELVRLNNIQATNFTFRRSRNGSGKPVITFRFKRQPEKEEVITTN